MLKVLIRVVVKIVKSPTVIPNLRKFEYGRKKSEANARTIRAKEKSSLKTQTDPMYLSISLEPEAKSLVAIVLSPKLEIVKKSAGNESIRLKAP